MATAEDGTVTFTKLQADKLKGHLVESLETPQPGRPPRPLGGGTARC